MTGAVCASAFPRPMSLPLPRAKRMKLRATAIASCVPDAASSAFRRADADSDIVSRISSATTSLFRKLVHRHANATRFATLSKGRSM